MNSYVAGVDLGTTFTAAAVQNGLTTEMVNLGPSASAVPSVMVRRGSHWIYGEAAADRAAAEPLAVARNFKRRIGDPVPMLVAANQISAEELSAQFLQWVLNLLNDRFGGPPEMLALTHPANWGQYRLELFSSAVSTVTKSKISLVPEPTAAAIHYASKENLQLGETICVYDLGGGTFDCAILRRTDVGTDGVGFEPVGRPLGLATFGGIDLDDDLARFVLEYAGIDIDELDQDDPVVAQGFVEFRRNVTRAKRVLSDDTNTTITVILPGVSSQIRITRREFEDLIRPRLFKTVDVVQETIRQSGLAIDDIDRVLLIGGSSRIPLVAQMLTESLGRPVAVDTDPKNAVALGAAITAKPPDLSTRVVPEQLAEQPKPLAKAKEPSLPPTPRPSPTPRSSPTPTPRPSPTPPLPSSSLQDNAETQPVIPSGRSGMGSPNQQPRGREHIAQRPRPVPKPPPTPKPQPQPGPGPSTPGTPSQDAFRQGPGPSSFSSSSKLSTPETRIHHDPPLPSEFDEETVGSADSAVNRRLLVASIGIGLVALIGSVIGIWVLLSGSDSSELEADDKSADNIVAEETVSTTRATVPAVWAAGESIEVGLGPGYLVETSNEIWVTNREDGTVSVIAVDTHETSSFDVGTRPDHLIAVGDSVWVADRLGDVHIINTATREIESVKVGTRPTFLLRVGNSVWVANSSSSNLSVIDITTHEVQSVDVGGEPEHLLEIDGVVWVANAADDSVTTLDADTLEPIGVVNVGQRPRFLLSVDDSVWVANETDGSVSIIDRETFEVTGIVTVGQLPRYLRLIGESVWVPNSNSASVSVIDSQTEEVIETVAVGRAPFSLLDSDGLVWVPNSASHDVTVIDVASRKPTETVGVGNVPEHVVAVGDEIWVSNNKDSTISIIAPRN